MLILPLCDIEFIMYFAAEAIVLIKFSEQANFYKDGEWNF